MCRSSSLQVPREGSSENQYHQLITILKEKQTPNFFNNDTYQCLLIIVLKSTHFMANYWSIDPYLKLGSLHNSNIIGSYLHTHPFSPKISGVLSI